MRHPAEPASFPGAGVLLVLLITGGACGGREAATDAGVGLDAPDGASPGGPVIIVNSGSTNAPGFRIVVTPDGGATWQQSPPRQAPELQHWPTAIDCAAPDGMTTLDGTLTATLFGDLAKAGSLDSLQFFGCLKSVSFGTTTSLTYEGVTLPDVECGSMTDARAAALTTDVKDVEKAITAACHAP